MNRWMPFNAVVDGTSLTSMIEREKQYIKKPVLFEEQLDLLQEKIVASMNTNTTIRIKYYYDGSYYFIDECLFEGKRKILFNNGKWVYLNQIIDVF